RDDVGVGGQRFLEPLAAGENGDARYDADQKTISHVLGNPRKGQRNNRTTDSSLSLGMTYSDQTRERSARTSPSSIGAPPRRVSLSDSGTARRTSAWNCTSWNAADSPFIRGTAEARKVMRASSERTSI